MHSPKRQADGSYLIALSTPIASPALQRNTAWVPTDAWATWATEQRNQLVGELLGHGSWFSRPPRRDVIESIFSPWIGRSMQSALQFFCTFPDIQCSSEGAAGAGSGVWVLDGLTMTATAITPRWRLVDWKSSDTISLFGSDEESGDEREIHLDDIALASPAAAPTRMRNREWEARKFLAKGRVRESRLKAQIADRIAAKEETRFYAQFGDLDENESHFSEYDLTEGEEESSESESP